ncbi:tetratricopeptide repeat protein [Clostridium sp. YIM B02515]|uniref:Tetratricopeptide repeat protein n=1 Tax=Clostridium rhizosphaerae TaxID=2803861 RepID=A0ABS1TGL1_9CLOT|nr:tetratricopeptide repeat protein [Clostridium rhizosphaerae]MBL4938533.1 tetratricopeptide repeat protein [Clostridium rhizosphaerae]
MKYLVKSVMVGILFISMVLFSSCSMLKYNSIGNFNKVEAEKLYKEQKYDEALKNVDDFLEKYPNNEKAISEKAYILIGSGKNEEGLVLLTGLYENGVQNSTILNNMSWAYNNLHMYTMANKYIDICLKSLNPTDKEYINKGNALHGLKKYDQAIGYYDKALEKDPQSTLALWGKGLCLYEMKDYKKCLVCFQKYAEQDGNNKSLNFYIKNSFINLKDLDGAINEFNKQIKKNPNNISAYSSLASIYEQKGEFQKTIDCYDYIIKKSPENADAYYNKSISLMKLGRSDEAIGNLKLAIEYDDEYVYDILDEPAFDSLKNNEKFNALIKTKSTQ